MIELKLQFDENEALDIRRAAAKSNLTLAQLMRWAVKAQAAMIIKDDSNGIIEDPWGKGTAETAEKARRE